VTHPIDIGHRHPCALMLAVLASIAATGCSSTFDDLELEQQNQTRPGCDHARPPGRPIGGTDEIRRMEFVTAVSEYDLGEIDQGGAEERYRTMSYDLDDTCTGQGQGPSCARSDFWTAIDPMSDGPDGRDNAHGATLHRAYDEQRSGSQTETTNSAIGSGFTMTTVIRVRGYNETASDSEVEVAVFAATLNPEGTFGNVPAWEGNDAWLAGQPWWVNEDEKGEPSIEHPKFLDAKAYVTGHTLVARLDEFVVPTIRLSNVVITADIVRNAHGWALENGIMAGRANTDDILNGLEFIRDDEGNWICKNSTSYSASKAMLCGSRDISFVKNDDPSTPCDATSWGWQFTALPAKLTGTTGAVPVHNCLDNGLPPSDSCSNHE
jgi:hypothetical protein